MSKSLYNCHRSRQMITLRHWWNVIFFVIIRLTIAVNQFILLAPFIYYRNSSKASISPSALSASNFPVAKLVTWKFRTHPFVTGMAIFLCIAYTIASPILIIISSELYTTTRPGQDNLFSIIAIFTMSTDLLCSILIMASLIFYRENIVKVLNLFNELIMKFEQVDKDIIGFKTFVALLLKEALFFHNVVSSLPFIISSYSRLSTKSIGFFLFNQYVQALSSIFTVNVFMFFLLLLSFSMQLEQQLKLPANITNDLRMSQLISLQNSLQQVTCLFVETVQFGIFFVILLNFITILCNIYALLDYYVTTHRLFGAFIMYIMSIALELYSLILVSYLYQRSQRKVKDLFLDHEESNFLKLSSTAATLVESDVLWPQLQEFQILGIFGVNNEFALFLFAYSINFIVIILEFEVNKARNK